jgi:thiamine-monophosphate kinase
VGGPVARSNARLGYIGGRLSLSEKALIQQIRSRAKRHGRVRLGIGDDCSILRIPAGHEALVTTDFSLEGVHFRTDWHSPEVIGHRCLTRGLSDIASMGGKPIAAFLSLALPVAVKSGWVKKLVAGLLELAEQFEVTLAGGDTAQSPGRVLADIVVLGSVPQGKAVLRSGARAGDAIYVTGWLGGAAATLDLLRAGRKLRAQNYPEHFHPLPRVTVGSALTGLASAMIDVSDGLSVDLGHLCEESGVGAEVSAATIPRARIGNPASEVELRYALHGGDDYELLFTVPAQRKVPRRIAGVPITRIGSITRGKNVMLIEPEGTRNILRPQGWQHFRKS